MHQDLNVPGRSLQANTPAFLFYVGRFATGELETEVLASDVILATSPDEATAKFEARLGELGGDAWQDIDQLACIERAPAVEDYLAWLVSAGVDEGELDALTVRLAGADASHLKVSEVACADVMRAQIQALVDRYPSWVELVELLRRELHLDTWPFALNG